MIQSLSFLERVAGSAWRGPFSTDVLSPKNIQHIKASQFDAIARAYRTAPLLMCTIAISLAFLLESNYQPIITVGWATCVCLSYVGIIIVQERYFQSSSADLNPDRWVKPYAGVYWVINSIWIFLLPIFWSPDNPTQNMFLYVILVCQVITVTAISFRNFHIYFSNSIPSILAIVGGSIFASGGGIYPVMGLLTGAFYIFLVGVARSAQFQNVDTFKIRFRNEELITDLAQAKQASDQARTRAEQANLNLREREELFRALVENAYDTIMLTDEAGFVRYAAPSIRQFDITPEQAIGRPLGELITTEGDDRRLETALTQEKQHGNVRELKEHIKTLGGREAWIEASITDLRDTEAVGGLVLNIRDVTERKRADDEMRNHLEVLNALARGTALDDILEKITTSVEETSNGGHSMVLLVDEDLCVTDAVGPKVDERLRHAKIGSTLTPSEGCSGAAIARGQRVVVSDIDSDPLEEGQRALLHDAGYAACWAQPIFSRNERILGVLATFYKQRRAPSEAETAFIDGAAHLTGIAVNRRQQERQLRDASESAEMANRAKSRFLATMSHELRTPLNAIIGFSEVMHQEMFGALGSDRYRDYTNDILISGRHLLSMIDDILDISKIEAGRYDLEERDIDMDDVIRWSAELIRPKLVEGGLDLRLKVTPDLPLVYADKRALRQVLLNLLSNAVKFTEEGGTISVSTELSAQDGLTVAVTDTGIGIPADRVRETLEPFVQVESMMTGKHHGTGLGLSITKHLVEMHNGYFDISSEEGIGTRVSFTFPPHRLVLSTDRVAGDHG